VIETLVRSIFLGILFGAQIISRPKAFFIARVLYSVSLVLGIIYLLFLSYAAYERFEPGILKAFNVYEGMAWFLPYIRFHIWNTYLVSFIVSLLFFFGARFLNSRREGMLLYDDEIWVAATSIFLVGYPGILFYGMLMAGILLIGSLIQTLSRGGGERFSAYFLWAPAALFVILMIQMVFQSQLWWTSFRF
jgi:hypothetical protein